MTEFLCERTIYMGGHSSTVRTVSFMAILANCVVRSLCPSQYVPYRRTCESSLGSPYTARTIATVAEGVFYHQVALSLGLQRLWYTKTMGGGVLLWLWCVGEVLSWIGLVYQSAAADALEDMVWGVWFTLALLWSTRKIRYILVPVVFVYLLLHLPNVYSSLKGGAPPTEGDVAAWVVPSVNAKLLLYTILVREG